jgi:hypothetical protein
MSASEDLLLSELNVKGRYEALKREAIFLSLYLKTAEDLYNLSPESKSIMSKNFHSVFMVMVRTIRTEIILAITKLLEDNREVIGIAKMNRLLIAFCNRLEKQRRPLHARVSHANFRTKLESIYSEALACSTEIKRTRDNFIAHNSKRKISTTGNNLIPSGEKVHKEFHDALELPALQKCASYIFDYFVFIDAALSDVDFRIKDIILHGDVKSLMFCFKELEVWQDLHKSDYEKKSEIRNHMKYWQPFHSQLNIDLNNL